MQTACGFDCYDACKIVANVSEDGVKLEADASHPYSNSALCRVLNQDMPKAPRITKPMVDGKEVSMSEALDEVAKVLGSNSLLWRGSGNFGMMQQVTDLLFAKLEAYTTKGTLCDGAGDAGVLEGRGVNRALPPQQIAKADVVVVWGRNITVTNSHLMPYIEGKKLIVIDPVKTPIAKMADLHIAIKPRMDYYLAIMLARFVFMDGCEDSVWCEEFASEYEEFYEYTREHRIKAILEYMDVDLALMGQIIEHLRGSKVVFLVGNGVQKYSTGSYTLHAIDSLGAILGLFGKEGCGVDFISNSKLGFDNPFAVKTKQVHKVNTPFSKFDTVLVQGGNPAESMPNSNKVRDELSKVANLIYFGLYENETSKLSRIIIPAKNFLEKDDIRVSYGHHYIHKMNKVLECEYGISEYEFSKELFDRLGFDGLDSEDEYISHLLKQVRYENNEMVSPSYEEIPYQNGFGEDGYDEFEFIDDFDDDFIDTKRFRKIRKKKLQDDKKLWLITPKASNSINTQFNQHNQAMIHPSLGYSDGDTIELSSEYGSAKFEVKLSEDVRADCVVLKANTKDVNVLTPDIISEYGDGACYQEVRVEYR